MALFESNVIQGSVVDTEAKGAILFLDESDGRGRIDFYLSISLLP